MCVVCRGSGVIRVSIHLFIFEYNDMRLFLVLEVVFGLCMDPKPFGIQERENKGTNVVQSIFRLYSSNLFSGYTGL